MGVLDKLLRVGEGRKIRALAALVPDISALEPELQKLSDDELKAKTVEFRERLDNGEELDDLLIEAFAVMREAGQRVLGQRHSPRKQQLFESRASRLQRSWTSTARPTHDR